MEPTQRQGGQTGAVPCGSIKRTAQAALRTVPRWPKFLGADTRRKPLGCSVRRQTRRTHRDYKQRRRRLNRRNATSLKRAGNACFVVADLAQARSWTLQWFNWHSGKEYGSGMAPANLPPGGGSAIETGRSTPQADLKFRLLGFYSDRPGSCHGSLFFDLTQLPSVCLATRIAMLARQALGAGGTGATKLASRLHLGSRTIGGGFRPDRPPQLL